MWIVDHADQAASKGIKSITVQTILDSVRLFDGDDWSRSSGHGMKNKRHQNV